MPGEKSEEYDSKIYGLALRELHRQHYLPGTSPARAIRHCVDNHKFRCP